MTQDEARELGGRSAIAAKYGDWRLVQQLKRDIPSDCLESYRLGYSETFQRPVIYFK